MTIDSVLEHHLSASPSQTESSDTVPSCAEPEALVHPSSSSHSASNNVNSSREGPIISNPCYDFGNIFLPSCTMKDALQAVKDLSRHERYSYLYDHVSPPSILPTTLLHGKKRRFNTSWQERYPWVLYSPKLDAIICGPCSLLLTCGRREDKGWLVNKPFNNWEKLNTTLSNHSKLKYHLVSVQAADTLRSTVINPKLRIDIATNSAVQSQMTENAHILRQIVRGVIYLAKQGIAFRGDIEISSQKNPGNLLALLKSYAETDKTLYNHIYSPKSRNATYLSPTSQNDIINIIGYDILRNSIVEDIKEAKFFSVLADEVSNHNVEHLAVCLRYVEANYNIREDFVTFIKLERVRAIDISEAITGSVEELGLSLNNLRGQGYDGASTMSGEKSGVQKRIRDKQPKAIYTHCAGHSFNLAILSSCTLPPIRNCIDQVKSITLWTKNSPKRDALLKAVVDTYGNMHSSSTSHTPLLYVCISRWVENIEGWERFTLSHPYLVKMCEVILHGDAQLQMYNDGWSAEDKKNALAYLKILE